MLNREEIIKCIKDNNLAEGLIDSATQITPNGLDLTAASVSEFDSAGALDFSNKERVLPQGKELALQKDHPQDKFGWWTLKPGIYKIKTNETVTIPKDLTAIAFTRTSLLRMGAFTQHGVWDAGFKGKSEFIMVVSNPYGLRLKQNARVAQLVFFPINETKEGYQGIYQDKK